MKKLFLLLAMVGMLAVACTPGGGLDDGNDTEQPSGGDNQGGGNTGNPNAPVNPGDTPADKTQAIEFQDDNAKLICTLHWDENDDGELSYEEAAAVTSLGTAFKGNAIIAFSELEYFTGLTRISNNAFEDCSSLIKITLPEQITNIGASAFKNCSNLKKITMPNSVTSIEKDAFYNCSNLTGVYVTDLSAWCEIDFTYEYANPLYYAKNLYLDGELVTDLVIPGGVSKIGSYVFYGYGKLTSDLVIPDSVASIGKGAFGCTSLISITIPNSVTRIGDNAFYECTSLTSATIPDSVTSIGALAFGLCSSLISANIPNGIKDISSQIFYSCTSLSSVTIGNSVTSIETQAFYRCSSLRSIKIPDSVTSIGAFAFSGCTSLTSITIPDGVNSIGGYVFYECTSLKEVYCRPITPPIAAIESSYYWDAFNKNASGRKIYVPRASVSNYRADYYWSEYASYIVGYDF